MHGVTSFASSARVTTYDYESASNEQMDTFHRAGYPRSDPFMQSLNAQDIDVFASARPWLQWAASPQGYMVIAPCLTVLVAIWAIWVFYRDLKRLFFKGVGPTLSHHTAAIVWLHGTGDAGAGFAFLRKAVMDELPHVKWVLPDAPVIPLRAANDAKKRAWFDVADFPIRQTGERSLDSTPFDDTARLERSVAQVHRWIAAEVAQGVPASRIVLGGFSQGAALALWAAARHEEKLGGVALWSGYAPAADELASALHDAPSTATPHLCCHGALDNKILPECGVKVCELLRQAGVPVTQKVYTGIDHACCPEQMDDLVLFLRRLL